MSLSINTNAGALVALRTLTHTNQQLAEAQNRVSTGLRVHSAKDNAAAFTVAQNLRAQLASFAAVEDSLGQASSVLDVTLGAVESIQGVIADMRAKAVAMSDAGLDHNSRMALARDYNALSDQITNMISSASFNGVNLISAAPNSLSPIVDPTGTRQISVPGQSIAVLLTFSRTLALNSSTTAAVAQAQVANIDSSLVNVGSTLADFGSKAQAIDLQLAFNRKLADATEIGLGRLVDADMARESARLQALQIKQQLGVQTLAIANQTPQALLALFQ